jgi:hypothetical protein
MIHTLALIALIAGPPMAPATLPPAQIKCRKECQARQTKLERCAREWEDYLLIAQGWAWCVSNCVRHLAVTPVSSPDAGTK